MKLQKAKKVSDSLIELVYETDQEELMHRKAFLERQISRARQIIEHYSTVRDQASEELQRISALLGQVQQSQP